MSRIPRLLPVMLAGAVMLAGCGHSSGGFADRTAKVDLDGSTSSYTVTSCGLDHQTAFVLGHADDGSVVQAVIGVKADHTTGVPASTGVTVSPASAAGTSPSTAPPGSGTAEPGTTVNPGAAIAAGTTVPSTTAPEAATSPIAAYEAFGSESWQRRGKTGSAPGTVTYARIKGARIQARGTAQPVDAAEHPTSGRPVPFSFDARCDAPTKQ